MTPLDWLLIVSGWVALLLTLCLAWFDLSQKLAGSLGGSPSSSDLMASTAPLPESFLVTEGEAARVEATLKEESQRRSQSVGRSERNWSQVR